MDITPIPEREAANLIGVGLRTIANAVKRGDLIRVPGTSITPLVAKEQAALFKGMKWVVKDHLSPTDKKVWEAVTKAITSPSMSHQDTETEEEKQIRNQLSNLPKLKGMNQTITIKYEPTDEREVPQGTPFLMERKYGIAART